MSDWNDTKLCWTDQDLADAVHDARVGGRRSILEYLTRLRDDCDEQHDWDTMNVAVEMVAGEIEQEKYTDEE